MASQCFFFRFKFSPSPLLASIIIINYYKPNTGKYVLCVLAECMCAVFLSYIESITFKKHTKKYLVGVSLLLFSKSFRE